MHVNFEYSMKKNVFLTLLAAVLLAGCTNEYNKILMSSDTAYKYECAKQYFAMGKFNQASQLLQDVVIGQKGRSTAQESLYMLALAEYNNRDYESASQTFKKYFSSYPKGDYAEQACFYIGRSLFESVPEPRLDQTPTVGAITAYQNFMDYFPDSNLRETAQKHLFLANTESNYEACIITAQNALKAYPYTDKREAFSILIMKSKYYLAKNSSEAKRVERYRDAEDECYGFLNEFPESKEAETAKEYIEKCKKITKD